MHRTLLSLGRRRRWAPAVGVRGDRHRRDEEEGVATADSYATIDKVGHGTYSNVYKARDRDTGKIVALKKVNCYMHQLLSGLQHCHERGILHRDIKGSNLLIDKNGMLKIGDFGLANYSNPERKRPLTSRVVTLWYRAPELLLGATDYGVGIDLWSSGCLLAEMLVGRPILPGRTEVEQLHRIFKLRGSPSEDYWRKLKLPALQSEFFRTSPLACDLSDLPTIPKDENDDAIALRVRRKRKTSKLKQHSQMRKESHMKLEQDMQIRKVDSGSYREVMMRTMPLPSMAHMT